MFKATVGMGALVALAGYGLGGLVAWALPLTLVGLGVISTALAIRAAHDKAGAPARRRAELARVIADRLARAAAESLARRMAVPRTVKLA